MQQVHASAGYELDLSAPLTARPAGLAVPLTATQRGLWRYVTNHGGSTLGNVVNATRIVGRLDVEALREALQGIVTRHEALRTRIITLDGAPRQAIDACARFTLELLDASALATAAHPDVRRLAEQFGERASDAATGPLFRAALLRCSAEDHVLVLAIDHIVGDAASANAVHRDLWVLYDRAACGLPTTLPPLPIQFADYAVWQDRTYSSWRRLCEGYWQARLTGASPTTLPDLAQSMGRTSATTTIPFGKKTSDLLRAAATQHNVSLRTVVLAAYACTMARWCERRDLLVAFVTHGRHVHPQLRDIVGCLAGGLLLRIDIGADTFLDLIQRIHCELDAALLHYDFDRASELFPHCATDFSFNWMSSTLLRGSSPGAAQRTLRTQPFPLQSAWLGRLFLFFTDSPAGIAAGVTYSTQSFSSGTVEWLGRQLRHYAESIAANPHARTSAAELSSPGSATSQ